MLTSICRSQSSTYPHHKELLSGLKAVGFSDATRTLLSGGITQLFVGTLDQ